jgi:hypothetical protein
LSVGAGPNQAPVRAGVNVPYSAEFKDQRPNPALLRSLAELTPQGGRPGIVLSEPKSASELEETLAADIFRHDLARATSRQDSWYLVALAAGCLFLLDVFNRRVIVGFAWVGATARWLRGYFASRAAGAELEESLSRLQARKSQVDREIDDRRAAARFEPETEAAAELATDAVAVATVPSAPEPAPAQHPLAPAPEEGAYTARLLKAKKRVWQTRKGPDGKL